MPPLEGVLPLLHHVALADARHIDVQVRGRHWDQGLNVVHYLPVSGVLQGEEKWIGEEEEKQIETVSDRGEP